MVASVSQYTPIIKARKLLSTEITLLHKSPCHVYPEAICSTGITGVIHSKEALIKQEGMVQL
jgi:hypothetical protein